MSSLNEVHNHTTNSFNLSEIHDAFLGKQLSGIDIFVIVLYFLSVLCIGLLAMAKTKRNTVGGYFLAGKSMLWWPIGASLFASNIGSSHFIGLAGSGAAAGIAVGAYEWNAMFIVLLLGWVFIPVYIASGVVTVPEYLYKRFGGKRIQICISFLYLFIYIFTKISVDLYAGAIFINQALKWNLYSSVLVLLFITALYTIGGGLAAVIYTDTLQALVIIVGAILLMIVGFIDIGGYSGLVTKYMEAAPTIRLANHTECGLPRKDAFHVLRGFDADLPWTAVVFGMPILSIWYWCADQVIVQRTLSARNLTHAKAATIMCSYLKVFPMFLMVMVGMISRAKFPDQVGCVVPEVCKIVCENSRSCSDIAYPKMIMELLPQGARGLMMAVVISALMSSLTSIFNSSSALFTMDIWNRLRRDASEKELMLVGRLFVFFLVVVSVCWIPIIQAEEGGQLFNYIQKISAYLQPPIAACFLLGIFWKRITEKGAFWGLFVGTIVGLVKLVVDFLSPDPVCGEDFVANDIHYLHFAIILFFSSLLIITVISLFTQPWPDKAFAGLTWWTRHELLSSDPMHLKNARIDTEHSNLVENDELQRNSYGNTGVTATPVGENHQKSNFTDIDLGKFSNLTHPSLVENPVGVSASFSVTDVEGVELKITTSSKHPSSQYDFRSIMTKFLSFICGFDSSTNQTSKKPSSSSKIATLEEDPLWRKVVNVNALICVVLALSVWIAFR